MRKILFPLLLIIAACSSDPVFQKNLIDHITLSEKGLIRGIDLGMSVEEVKAIEANGLTEDDTDYLFYEFLLDSARSYTLEYSFENDSLKEIRSDIYLKDAEEAAQVIESFVKYYTKKYTEPLNDKGNLWIWSTIYNEKKIKIELTDESADYNSGKLSISIYQESDEFL